MKKSKTSGKDYYVGTLQTSPTKFTRIVGFDKKTHDQAVHYQTTGGPLKLVGVKEQDGQFFINQTSAIMQVNANDVDFQNKPPSSIATSSSSNDNPGTVASDITLGEIHTLTRNQRVNVKGIITLGKLPPKELTKPNGEKGKVK